MDRVEREVKKLQDTLITLRRELDGNRDDVSSIKKNVDSVRKDTRVVSDETRTLDSKLRDLRQSVPTSDAIDKLRDALTSLRQSSLDRTSEANELRRELNRLKTELNSAKDGQAALKEQVEGLKTASKDTSAPKDYAREVSALRLELKQLRQETAQKPTSYSQAQSSSFSAKELDILTRNITKIGNRASQIETLQMEFQLFKSRIHRLEAAELPEPAQRDEYDLPPFFDDEDGQQNSSTKTPAQTRKRMSLGRDMLGESATSNKRLAFLPDAEEGPDPTALNLPGTSPLDDLASERGARKGRGSARSSRSSTTGRRVRGRGRNSFPME